METEFAIIGAGPAGSAAALALARAGRRVVVFEKKLFPREKVCGGCLSGRALQELRTLLGSDVPLPGAPSERIGFAIGRHYVECAAGWATRLVLRAEFDAWLARQAALCGAEFRFGTSAALTPDTTGWVVEAGATRCRAATVLVAVGLGGLAAQLPIVNAAPRRRMLAQAWVQPPAAGLTDCGAVAMHWLRGGYVGLATPQPGCCVVALAADIPQAFDEPIWERLRRMNPGAPIFAALAPDAQRRFKARGTAGFPWRPARLGDANCLLIGDAAGYVEPFSGEGIGQALCSARSAVDAILGGGAPLPAYTRLMRARHAPVLRRLSWIGRMLRLGVVQWAADQPRFVPERLIRAAVRRVHVGPAPERT